MRQRVRDYNWRAQKLLGRLSAGVWGRGDCGGLSGKLDCTSVGVDYGPGGTGVAYKADLDWRGEKDKVNYWARFSFR
jgi:hypothetical protein